MNQHTASIRHVAIVGAGLGGLTAALALLKRGFEVTVLEQASALSEVGAGVQLSANATRVLRLLGLSDAIAACGAEAEGKVIRHWSTGRTWPVPDLAADSRSCYGDPYVFFHRADLHAALVDGVRRTQSTAIRLDSRCEEIDLSGPRPAVVLQTGERVVADLVIGADGVIAPLCVTKATEPARQGSRGRADTVAPPARSRKPLQFGPRSGMPAAASTN